VERWESSVSADKLNKGIKEHGTDGYEVLSEDPAEDPLTGDCKV